MLIMGALILGFSLALFKGSLTTHWQAPSSSQRPKGYQIPLALQGPSQRHSHFHQSKSSLLSIVVFKHSNWHPRFISKQTCAPHPQFSLVDSRDAHYLATGTLCCGSRCLILWENQFAIPTTDSYHTTLHFSMQSISRYFCGLALLLESSQLAFIIHFNEFPTVSGREKDLQLHLDMANYLGGATRKNFQILRS